MSPGQSRVEAGGQGLQAGVEESIALAIIGMILAASLITKGFLWLETARFVAAGRGSCR